MQYGHGNHLTRYLRITSVGVALVAACTANPYVIGVYLPGGDAGRGASDGGVPTAGPDASGPSAVSFSAPLASGANSTGTSNLSDTLILGEGVDGGSDASAPVTVILRLRGETATATSWPSDQGVSLAIPAGGNAPNVGLSAPFSDSTRAVALAATEPSYVAASSDAAIGDIGNDDAAFELVFRAEPGQIIAAKGASGSTNSGWALTTSSVPAGTAASALGSGGNLLLDLSDGQQLVEVSSEPLTADAWYHCMLWLSHDAGARIDCNGDGGNLTDIHLLGSLASTTTSLSIGGVSSVSADSLQVAYLSVFRAASGTTLGTPDAWLETSRQRFAALTGVLPAVALGTALPNTGLRGSTAYVDLADGSGRHLFLVGADWPRVACRTDSSGRFCGYLSERARGRLLPPDPSGWTTSEVTVNANYAAGGGAAQDVLSFYARAETGHLLGVQVSGQNEAVFDLSALSASSPAGVGTTIEPWGAGLVRCAYTFKNAIAGPVTFELHLLDSSPSGEPFAGDGQSAWVDVAGLQVDVSTFYPRSLVGADAQLADQLVFIANDGNLPKGSSVSISLQVLLPAGPRLDDQAILNLNFQDDYTNQVDLYVTGATGDQDAGGSANTLEFSGLLPGPTALAQPTTLWAFNNFTSVIDGNRHSIRAEWTPRAASVWVDQMQPATEALLVSGAMQPPLDRMEVGFSVNSSGPLEGLVSSIAVGVP
jgi:hypothetical protein